MTDVQIVDRPGYFGKQRREKEAEYTRQYEDWGECWQVGLYIYSFDEAVLLYDDAYYEHLSNNPRDLGFVLSYEEVYDSHPSNTLCGINHDPHSVPRHIQDVSIRRALVRIGCWFLGTENRLLQVRGEETEGFRLNPGNVPFHAPHLILAEDLGGPTRDWMKPGSTEWFWQKNKVIVTGLGDK